GWRRTAPTANVGLALGRLCRVDVDGPAGVARLQERSGGDLPPTLVFRRGDSGSRGLLYRLPDGSAYRTTYEQQQGKHRELRLQALGAQTVLPPSRHPSGDLYEWVPGHGPGEMGAAPAPAWALRMLEEMQLRRGSKHSGRAPGRGSGVDTGKKITE